MGPPGAKESMAGTVDRAQAREASQRQLVSGWREASGQAGRQDSSEKSAVRERLRGSWRRTESQMQVCSRWKRLEMEGTGKVRRTRADQVLSPISNPLCEQGTIRFEADCTELYFTEKHRCLPTVQRASECLEPALQC